jgi:ribose/xylose/arabinose/galactoside ABC-type transport system permease subunit
LALSASILVVDIMHPISALALRHHLLVAVVAVFLLFAWASPFFASSFNLLNLLRESAELGIVCLGATLVLLIGRLDLSVGAVMAISALLMIVGFKALGLPWPLLIPVALLFGLVVGAINGVFTAVIGVPSFIATLGMLVILRGILQWATATETMRAANSTFTTDVSFLFIGNGLALGLPVSFFVFSAFFLVLVVLLKATRIGTAIYAMGGNIQAALRAGIRVRALEIGVFAFAGFLSAVAGVLLASRLDSVSFQTGQYLEFTVLIAVILGGTSIAGGIGGVWGTLLGTALVGILANGMVMLAIDRDVQDIVLACFLVTALLIDRYLHRNGLAQRRWRITELWPPWRAEGRP